MVARLLPAAGPTRQTGRMDAPRVASQLSMAALLTADHENARRRACPGWEHDGSEVKTRLSAGLVPVGSTTGQLPATRPSSFDGRTQGFPLRIDESITVVFVQGLRMVSFPTPSVGRLVFL